MWIIIAIIVIVVIVAYSAFSKMVDRTMNNDTNNFAESKWWKIGMLTDMHNKRNDKK